MLAAHQPTNNSLPSSSSQWSHPAYSEQQGQQQQQQHSSPFSSFSAYDHSVPCHLPTSHSFSSFDSTPAFSATPLTPNPSQSQFLNPPPLADPSSVESSPVFSAINSPVGNDFAAAGRLFDFSADPSLTNAEQLSSLTSPLIKLYQHPAVNGAVDSQDFDGSSMFLQSSLPFDYLDSDDYASILSPPEKKYKFNHFNQYPPASQAAVNAFQTQSQEGQRRLSTASSAPSHSFPSTPVRPLPTPEHTPAHTSSLASPFNSYDPSRNADGSSGAEMAMRLALQNNHQPYPHQQQTQAQHYRHPSGNGNESPFSYSFAPSISTLNSNSPATPQTNYAGDDASRGISHGEDLNPDESIDRWMDDCLQLDNLPTDLTTTSGPPGMPKINRTVSDLYQDELYNPAMSAMAQSHSQPARAQQQQQQQQHQQPQHQQQQQGSKGFPSYQNIINDRLQAAQQGHMAAQAQAQAVAEVRQSSPFRQGSPYAQPATAYHSAHLQQPSQFSSELPQSGLRGMALMNGPQEPKTISPKEALLEYHEPSEEANIPLFPPQPDSSQYNVRQSSSNGGSAQSFPAVDQLSNQFGQTQQAPQQYYLQQRALQQRLRQQQQQQHQPQPQQPPFQPPQQPLLSGQHHENQTYTRHFGTPSNASSEASFPSSEQRDSMMPTEGIRRPDDTSSDAGTYSCTYHGCTLRFDTPARLQKHKREAHRQSTPGSHGLLRDGSGALRNSQAGPHKCERINPSTGKPCNSIFSRPYDLTRHEDTIHNARKQKVRCHLCTEEKTFSRNDALTRHMRVVHPEVSWPGKQKRKGRE